MPEPTPVPTLGDHDLSRVVETSLAGSFTCAWAMAGAEARDLVNIGPAGGGGETFVHRAGMIGDADEPLILLLGPADPSAVTELRPVAVHRAPVGTTGLMLLSVDSRVAIEDQQDRRALRDLVEHAALDDRGNPIGVVLAEVEPAIDGSIGAQQVGWPGAKVSWPAWSAATNAFAEQSYGYDVTAEPPWPLLHDLFDMPARLVEHIGTPSGQIISGEAGYHPPDLLPLPLAVPPDRWPVSRVDAGDRDDVNLVVRFGATRPVHWVWLPDLAVEGGRVGFGDPAAYASAQALLVGDTIAAHTAEGAGIVQEDTGGDGAVGCALGLDRLGMAVAAAIVTVSWVADLGDVVGDTPAHRHLIQRIEEEWAAQPEPGTDVMAAVGAALAGMGIDATVEDAVVRWQHEGLSFYALSEVHEERQDGAVAHVHAELPAACRRTRDELDDLLVQAGVLSEELRQRLSADPMSDAPRPLAMIQYGDWSRRWREWKDPEHVAEIHVSQSLIDSRMVRSDRERPSGTSQIVLQLERQMAGLRKVIEAFAEERS